MDELAKYVDFMRSHETVQCDGCGRCIIPGNSVCRRERRLYCSMECACADALGIKTLKLGDDGYGSIFPKKRHCNRGERAGE